MWPEDMVDAGKICVGGIMAKDGFIWTDELTEKVIHRKNSIDKIYADDVKNKM